MTSSRRSRPICPTMLARALQFCRCRKLSRSLIWLTGRELAGNFSIGRSRRQRKRLMRRLPPRMTRAFLSAGDRCVVGPIDAGLILVCRSSYRGVKELLRDLFNIPFSVGTIHNRLQSQPGKRAPSIDPRICPQFVSACMTKSSRVPCRCWLASMRLPPIAIFCRMPSIATLIRGRYICSMPMRKDLIPITRSPTRGKDVRAGQKTALGDTPCHAMSSTFSSNARACQCAGSRGDGRTSRREALDVKMDAAKANSCGNTLSAPLALARQTEERTCQLART